LLTTFCNLIDVNKHRLLHFENQIALKQWEKEASKTYIYASLQAIQGITDAKTREIYTQECNIKDILHNITLSGTILVFCTYVKR